MERCYFYRVPVNMRDIFARLDKVFWADHTARLYWNWNYEDDGKLWASFVFLSDSSNDHNVVKRQAELLGGELMF